MRRSSRSPAAARRPARAAWLLASAGVLAAPPAARAAGGHHAVDDAALLDPGACQVEAWIDRAAGGRGTLVHVGPGCRVGPVELSLILDRFQAEGAGTTSAVGPQIKWARELVPGLSAGVVVAALARDHEPRYVGSSVVVPLTWEIDERWRVHLNAGRDFLNGAPDVSRSGVAAEWLASPRWSMVAERFREVGLDFWRVAVRYAFPPGVSIDLGRAEGMAGAPSRWAIGVNVVLDR